MKFVLLEPSITVTCRDMPLLFHKKTTPDTEIGIWHCTEESHQLLSRVELEPSDEAILETMKNEQRKRQWLGCRLVLSTLLDTQKVFINHDAFGKPWLISSPLNISLTHSGTYAAAILSSRSSVGIDLELVREKIARVADRFLTHAELEKAEGDARIETLTLFWAVKEALFKIHGKPELNLQDDISIESFEYLCGTSGRLVAKIKLPGNTHFFPVNYQRFDSFMLAWVQVSDQLI